METISENYIRGDIMTVQAKSKQEDGSLERFSKSGDKFCIVCGEEVDSYPCEKCVEEGKITKVEE